jgi:hypothetical protein
MTTPVRAMAAARVINTLRSGVRRLAASSSTSDSATPSRARKSEIPPRVQWSISTKPVIRLPSADPPMLARYR